MENVGKKPDVARIPLTFDCSDETQCMVCNLLKSAGYGKRTPIVVKAICLLMGRANSAEDGGNAAVSDEKLSALVYEAVVKALRDTGRSGAENIRTPTEEVREEKEPQQKTEKKETAVTRLAEYDLPEDVINSALAFADRFG